ncbi:ADP-ribosylglycohydrolase family protein [Acidithiobacillus sp. IBUN Pt1247-S3]|uniref:ADP-ribosylglycohydrolase family protein n=1 Tax=Acidithiobacillus sp. IBUN Pt1247-S3 TaxID=3166642 RepID=UPI0034E3C516
MQRVAGALMGALIGDALALGCHWYYDLAELHHECGPWITEYLTPRPGRYHSGLLAGDISQTGLLLVMLMESLVDCAGYQENDFTHRLDTQLFPQLDGTPMQGPGGYTNQSIREAWRKRVLENRPWEECAGDADTTEGAERAIAIAAFYALQPSKMAEAVCSNITLTQHDPAIVAMSMAFNSVLAQLVAGASMTPEISTTLMAQVKSGALPFHTVTQGHLQLPSPGGERIQAGQFASPDALLTAGYAALAAADPDIVIEPAWKASLVYGMPCAIYHQLPAAYYLATRFQNNYESAVLHAINGGGQNMSRAMLTGALVGAQVGLEGIPHRFITELHNAERYLALAAELEQMAIRERTP